MANSRILPSASAPLSDPRGLATPQFYRFFQALSELDVNSASQSDIAALKTEIAAIQDEINALPPAQGYPDLQVSVPLFSQGLLKNGFALIGVNTLNSVVVNGNALQLGGDTLAPGNTFLYSTGPTGAKGWNALSGMLHQTANILLTTGADGTVTFTLGGAAAGDLSGTYPSPTVAKVNGTPLGMTSAVAGEVLLGTGTAIASTPISGDATLSGTGALTLAASGVTSGSYGDATHTATFTVDAKGRLTLAGTSAIAFPVTSVFGRAGAVVAASGDYNTGQVIEGTNLYFTAARVLATVLAGLSTATNAVITAADTVLVALGKLQAQISANVTAIAGKLAKAANLSDVADAATARGNLGVVIPQGYIDGLQMVWNSATSISVTSGTAYIPSLGNVLVSNSTLTLSGLSLTASTWYHVYLYSNAGVPAIECVTTAPVLYYGTAYQKTGDNTRRYIGSLKTDATSKIYKFNSNDGKVYFGLIDISRALSSGNATVSTAIDISLVAPITAISSISRWTNQSNSTTISTQISVGSIVYSNLPATMAGLNYVVIMDMACPGLALAYFNSASGGATFLDIIGYSYQR